MNKAKKKPADCSLRQRAEEHLKTKPPEICHSAECDDSQRLLHELQVHQVELEMQNAELRRSRHETETALEKYTELYEFAPVGYFTLSRTGIVKAVNLAGACLIGVERSRLINLRFGPFVVSEQRQFFSDFLEKIFAGRRTESCEIALTSETNSPSYVQIEAIAFGDGQQCHVAVIDITGRRYAEEDLASKQLELEVLNASLGERITQSVDDLRKMDQILILQDRRAVMGEMINNIAHQWRQPLNVLGLYLQELPIVYNTSKFNREYLESSVENSMKMILHMSETIDDFRNFFRTDKAKVMFSVEQMIQKTLSLVTESFKDQQIRIVVNNNGHHKISGYPNEYGQVLLNILMNARDALVGKNVDNARITICAREQENRSVVTITDNGGGIEKDIMDRLFDPYFTTKALDKGTGIGLFMSKTIIEKNMGGKLTVKNSDGGAEFRVVI